MRLQRKLGPFFILAHKVKGGTMILLVDKIEKSFGARVLFSGASFQINPGERFALVGPNGAGKTTMLKIITGISGSGYCCWRFWR